MILEKESVMILTDVEGNEKWGCLLVLMWQNGIE